MFFKPGVLVGGLCPECLLGMIIVRDVFQEKGQRFTVTSVLDGKHMPSSLHYHGLAFDVRIFDLRGISAYDIAVILRDRLPLGFQVVVESDHLHVEYDHEAV